VLRVYETKSYLMPLILMISIPLTTIGILSESWLLNALTADPGGVELHLGRTCGRVGPAWRAAGAAVDGLSG